MNNSSNNKTQPDGADLKDPHKKAVKYDGDMAKFVLLCLQVGLEKIFAAGHWIRFAVVWFFQMLRFPFRFIHAGFAYAVFFLIAVVSLSIIYWTGDGALMMRSSGELIPKIRETVNDISVEPAKIVMRYNDFSDAQDKLFSELRAQYRAIVAKKAKLDETKDLEEEEKTAQEKQIRQEYAQLFQNAKPMTGIDSLRLKNIRHTAIKPEILEVTLAVVNVNQNSVQHFLFRLYDPSWDIRVSENPESEQAKAEQQAWEDQNKLADLLCSRIHNERTFQEATEEALKKKDDADKAASKLKDEAKRKEILSKRVEDYFCDVVSAEDREALNTFIRATNLDEGSSESANQHETEKVYIYVNRAAPRIIVNFEALNSTDGVSQNLLNLFNYPTDNFNFATNSEADFQMLFAKVNSQIVSPAEQRIKLNAFRQRDIVAEELERINNDIKTSAAIANKQNKIRIENEVQLVIEQRPEGMKELTPEGKQNIREQVIKDLKIREVVPTLRERKSVTKEEKQRWLANALEKEGVEASNLFYNSEVIDVIRVSESAAGAESFLGGASMICAIVILSICALLSLLTALGSLAETVLPRIGKERFRDFSLKDNKRYIQANKIVYYIILAGICYFFIYWCGALYTLCDIPDKVLTAIPEKELFQPEEKTLIWLHYFYYWLPGAVLCAIALLASFSAGTKADFFLEKEHSKPYHVLTCKTKDGGVIRSFYWITLLLVFLLVEPYAINTQYLGEIKNPFAPTQENYMQLDSYEIPGGGGGTPPPKTVVIKKKKKKKVKKYVVSQRTSIIFEIPDLNDDQRLQEIDDATETQYTTGSMFGKGKSKGKPGWAGGMEDGKIRFIRLQYSGGGDSWNWNMGKGADYNMLIYLRDVPKFQVANDTESITINKLAKGFRKGKKPPFVYMTGRGSINLSSTEVKQLNEYLLKDGGMIFADNAGGSFGHHFRAMLKRVLPNHKLIDIANDDPIYKSPYFFPNGAPAFFHHDGYRAMGIKNNGRWVVFYHPGDIGDAWKGAGLTEQQQTDAFKLGANVISYAFGAYLEELSKE